MLSLKTGLCYISFMITVTILTKNCEKTLRKTLESVKGFSEVVVLDTGSVDHTLKVASGYPNVKIFHSPFIGFGPLHNLAIEKASYDWILSLDSDEVLTEPLIQEILSLSLNSDSIYSMERTNFFKGKHIKWCGGWYPDRVIRLFHRRQTSFSRDLVHEKVIANGLKETALTHPMLHTPYLEISDLLGKMQTYTSLFAEQKKTVKSSVTKALFHSWYAFFKSYILKRGFLGGKEGFIISIYNGHTAFYKYLKLAERIDKELI